ncbi:MAG: IS110 family transposase [Patescibacteria group bacterium]
MFYLGIDVGKHSHSLCLLQEDGQRSIWQIDNSKEGFNSLATRLKDIDHSMFLVGMEATGHYFLNLYQFFLEKGFDSEQLALLNPLQVKAFRNTNLRGAKSDNIDAERIATLLRFGDFQRCNVSINKMMDLRQLTRLRYGLVSSSSDLKRRIIAVLDRIFPEFGKIFENKLGKTALALIEEYPFPENLASLSLNKLKAIVKSLSKRGISDKKIEALHYSASNSIGIGFGKYGFRVELDVLLVHFSVLQQQINVVEKKIKSIMEDIDTQLLTIPGLGLITGATILSEIGNIDNFSSAVKLIAFAGLDPKLKESGSYQGRTPISKRGSKYLRSAIWYSAMVACRVEPSFKQKYQERKDNGKSHRYCITAAANKLTKVIYHVLKNNCSFQTDLL